jgi:BolA protein
MNAADKLELIKTRLHSTFSPTSLLVTDDSAQHVGHAGHGGGGRHFSITISSDHFAGKSRVDAHREIYTLFSDLIPQEIHALKIKII